MKVFEIIAPLNEEIEMRPSGVMGPDGKIKPFLGPDGKTPLGYEVYDTETKKVIQRFTGADAAGKAEEFRDKARRSSGGSKSSKKTKPSERIKKLDPTWRQRYEKLANERITSFTNNSVVKFLEKHWITTSFLTITTAIASWCKEMAAINTLWDAGEYRTETNPAQAVQADRAEATHLCVTEIISNIVAFIALAKTSTKALAALRACMSAWPGPGWAASLVLTVAELGFFYWLNKRETQEWIAYTMLGWAWPAADWVGSVGKMAWPDAGDKFFGQLRDIASDPGSLSDRGKQERDAQQGQPANTTSTAPKQPVPANQRVTGTDWTNAVK